MTEKEGKGEGKKSIGPWTALHPPFVYEQNELRFAGPFVYTPQYHLSLFRVQQHTTLLVLALKLAASVEAPLVSRVITLVNITPGFQTVTVLNLVQLVWVVV